MEIVKEAFVEGRETKTLWDKSQAKSNQLKLEVALENFSMMKKKENYTPIPLLQICPTTKKVLNTFPSRVAAARHIVNNILKRPEVNPIAVTGNLDMCMRAGWKSYGYYWKVTDEAGIEKNLKKIPNAQKVFAYKHLKGGLFPSLQEAADTLGVSADRVAKALRNVKYKIPGMLIQPYNPTLRTLTFANISEACRFANVSAGAMERWVKNGKVINNTIYKVEKPVKAKTEYRLYDGKRPIGRFTKAEDVAKVTGVHRASVNRYAKSHESFGMHGQYKVVVRKV